MALKAKLFSSKRVGFTISWLTVFTQLASLMPSSSDKLAYLNALVSLILGQVLSNNFHIRTFVEAVLVKIYTDHLDTGSSCFDSVTRQIEPIVCSVAGDKERHAQLVMSYVNFRLRPLGDYSLETIYYHLPRLSGLIEDEWIDLESFRLIASTHMPAFDGDSERWLKWRNADTLLGQCVSGVWKFTANKDESMFDPTSSTVSVDDFQKKIIPWHSLLPVRTRQEEFDMASSSSTKRRGVTESGDGLVVLSSLIDKGTNLGGICRTCEIFNVSELVLDSIKLVEDKVFQTLAVTADQWLPIKEVPVKSLRAYLFEMKYVAGYRLVGLEQTAQSTQLDKFTFPTKTVLVLG